MNRIHPTALISSEVSIGENVSIGAYSILEGTISIGAHSTLYPNTQIYGQVSMGEHNIISSNSVIGGPPQDLSYDESKIQSQVSIGNNNVIRENVTINRGATQGGTTSLGNHCYLMAGSHLGHDSTVSDHCILANATLLGGFVNVGTYAFMGGGSAAHQFVNIGAHSIVQGHGGLSQDLPPYCISHSMNTLSGLNAIGMKRRGYSSGLRHEIKTLYKLLFTSGKNLSDAINEALQLNWSPESLQLLNAVRSPSRKGVLSRKD